MELVMNLFKILLKVILYLPCFFYSTLNFSVAQESDVLTDDVIIVTSNRRPQPLSQIGSSVSIISEADLERGQQSFVLDALETLPGVAISQNGSFGGTASISIRGAGGDNTVFLIDGVQMNDASTPGGAFNFGAVDTYNIKRIEVLRGPQSILYGSDAIGGVINVITKSGGEGLGGKIFLEGGAFNTRRGGASFYGGTDKLGFNISASGLNTDGISKADENDGNLEPDGLKSYSFSGKIKANLSEIFKLEAHGNYSNSNGFYDDYNFSTGVPFDGSKKQTNNTDQFSAVIRGKLNLLDDRLINKLSVEYSKIDRALYGNYDPFLAKGIRTNFDYLGVFTINPDWTATWGAQHEKTKSDGNNQSSFDINSIFSEVAFTAIKDLVLTAGSRYDDHETYGGHVSSRVTASYQFNKIDTKVLANWGQGFRAPSISQLTFKCLTCNGINKNLNPETSSGFEMGIVKSFFDKKITIGATYFHLNVNDKITYVSYSKGYKNIAKTLSQGVELSASGDLTDNIFIKANYTYSDAQDKTTSVTSPLIREPKHLLSGSIQWAPSDRLSASLLVTYNGNEGQLDGTILKSWTRLDIRTSYELLEGLIVYARIDNILNKEYQYIPAYGTSDRSFFMGLRKTF